MQILQLHIMPGAVTQKLQLFRAQIAHTFDRSANIQSA